ncbi:hypothetical protein AGDE_13326 [Angomonas deanei]|nr:hypothetical protein AGDE_13326 [Angomonas deanei]|eukprot:EPY22452.1 hypothetical protein AGDE_13326 [Angomonas deanei]
MGHFLELQPLQEELTQIQTRVVDLGSRVLATQHLLQRASDAAVTVELKFSIGRGPAPPEDSGELNASLKKKGAKKK